MLLEENFGVMRECSSGALLNNCVIIIDQLSASSCTFLSSSSSSYVYWGTFSFTPFHQSYFNNLCMPSGPRPSREVLSLPKYRKRRRNSFLIMKKCIERCWLVLFKIYVANFRSWGWEKKKLQAALTEILFRFLSRTKKFMVSGRDSWSHPCLCKKPIKNRYFSCSSLICGSLPDDNACVRASDISSVTWKYSCYGQSSRQPRCIYWLFLSVRHYYL